MEFRNAQFATSGQGGRERTLQCPTGRQRKHKWTRNNNVWGVLPAQRIPLLASGSARADRNKKPTRPTTEQRASLTRLGLATKTAGTAARTVALIKMVRRLLQVAKSPPLDLDRRARSRRRLRLRRASSKRVTINSTRPCFRC
eukprot:3931165-Rhodomonas_salina.1